MTERKIPARTPLERALAECEAFNRLGGLTHDVICDIALDHEIDADELEKAFNV